MLDAEVTQELAHRHIGEPCPRSCAGKIYQVVAIGYSFERRGEDPHIEVEYECSTGHRRVFVREPVPRAA